MQTIENANIIIIIVKKEIENVTMIKSEHSND